MTDDFNATEDTWSCIWEAMALTDPRSTTPPETAVQRHKLMREKMKMEEENERDA